MKLNETRESAHLRSRVTDLSVVPNLVSYNALLACITPLASQNVEFSKTDNTYKPMLIRDVDTLIANFGDPRIDPEKYVDLYAIMRMVKNGGTCYLAKVVSGSNGVYEKEFTYDAKAGLKRKEKQIQAADNEWSLTAVGPDSENTSNIWETTSAAENTGEDVLYTKENPPVRIQITENSTVTPTVTPYSVVPTEPTDRTVKYELIKDKDGIKFSYRFTFKEKLNLSDSNKHIAFIFETDDFIEHHVPDCKYVEDTISDNILLSTGQLTGVELKKLVLVKISGNDENKADVSIPLSDIESVELNTENKLIIKLYKAVPDKWKKATFTATFCEQKDGGTLPVVPKSIKMLAYSALTENIEITQTLNAIRPTNLNVAVLITEVFRVDKTNNIKVPLGESRIRMSRTLTNQNIIDALNTKLGTYVQFDLDDAYKQYADCAFSSVDHRDDNSIVKILNLQHQFFDKDNDILLAPIDNPLQPFGVVNDKEPNFEVKFDAYQKALDQYKDKRYSGCILADMTSKVTYGDATKGTKTLKPMSKEDLRTLHYYIKGIAAERKDCTALLSTPEEIKTISAASEFALSTGEDASYWEYGETPTTDYTLQSFYLEMYYPWLQIKCNKISAIGTSTETVDVAPTAIVLDNILKSYRERGVHYPVAGDQYGQLSDTFSVINNPKTKLDRDQLIKSRINPIWDTGKRGIQIYGNETLNAGYTDLNAAHIARTLVYIHNKIDEYTETLKFNINSVILWNRWKSYVSDYILEPLKSENAISDYEVMMGEDTTTREEIANRMLKGKIKLIFYQAAEVIDLDYIVYSSSNVTIADAESQI